MLLHYQAVITLSGDFITLLGSYLTGDYYIIGCNNPSYSAPNGQGWMKNIFS